MSGVAPSPTCRTEDFAGARVQRNSVKLGLHFNDFAWPVTPDRLGSLLGEIAQAGEAAGFDTIAVMDHVWQHPYAGGGPEGSVLEGYATLAYLAAHTQRAKLLALASPVSYRFPGMLAKTVTTLGVLSGGRAWLGIGVGDYEDEARGLGIPYPSLNVRYALLEETVQICLRMWTGEHGDERPYHGVYVQLERPLNSPQSLTRPHPPIMIASSGERRTLPLVAGYADACNLRPGPQIPRQLEILRCYCESEGHDYDAIEKPCPFRFDVGEDGAKAGALIDQLRGFSAMGIETVFGRVVDDYRITPIEIMGREVIPAVADL